MLCMDYNNFCFMADITKINKFIGYVKRTFMCDKFKAYISVSTLSVNGDKLCVNLYC
jgi:hypothetical protein